MVSVQIAALIIAVSAASETVLLDFYAPWCGPCKTMDSTVSQLKQAGYPVQKVNVDQDRAMAARYKVEALPCFVMLVDGKETGRVVGAVPRGELLALFQKSKVRPNENSTAIARAQSPDPPPRGMALPIEPTSNPLTPARNSTLDYSGYLAQAQTHPRGAVDPQALIASSVRLKVEDPKGQSFGTGTLIDARAGDALVLTCGHLFRDSQGKGEIWVELLDPNNARKLKGHLISYDLKSDVALVSIRPGTPLRVAPVAPRSFAIAKGDKVITVGCNGGGEPTALESKITGIDKFLGPPNLQVAGQPVQGRSGGGLFAADGRVIGVCNAADPADNEGLYAALASIQAQLDAAGLMAVYERPSTPDTKLLQASVPTTTPAPALVPVTSPRGGVLSSRDMAMTESERAVLAKLEERTGAEVICIVRTLSNPQAQSEVIKLDRASPAFLRQLAADQEAQQARHLTSFDTRDSRPRAK